MTNTIDFPHLGIHLSEVGQSVSVFGFRIAYYGIMIGIGVILAVFMASMEAKRTKQDPDIYLDVAMYGVLFGIIGARLYYVAFAWDMYKDNLMDIFKIREGGLAIYGGIIAGVFAVFIYTRIKKLNFRLVLDTASFAIPTGQMMGRWGNFFNREAFGEYTDGLFAMRLPVDAVRARDVTEQMKAHMEAVDGVQYIQVTPTFLYESCWCLLIIVFLLLFRYKKKFHGEMFLIYVGLYGLGRFWIEGLRTDQLLLPGIGLPVSQCLSLVLILVSVILIALGRKVTARQEQK